MRVIGVDLAWGARGRTGLCAAEAGRVLDSATVRSDAEIDAWIGRFSVPERDVVVAIDAPLIVAERVGPPAVRARLLPRHGPAAGRRVSRPPEPAGVPRRRPRGGAGSAPRPDAGSRRLRGHAGAGGDRGLSPLGAGVACSSWRGRSSTRVDRAARRRRATRRSTTCWPACARSRRTIRRWTSRLGRAGPRCRRWSRRAGWAPPRTRSTPMCAPTSRSIIGAGTGAARWWWVTWPAGISSPRWMPPPTPRCARGASGWRCRSREEEAVMVKIRKLRDGGRGDPERRRARGPAAGAQGRGGGGDRESVRRPVRRRPHAADRRRRGARRAAGQEGHRGAGRAGRVLRQGGGRRRGRRVRARGGAAPSQARRAAAGGRRRRQGHHPVGEEARRARHRHRRAAALQGRRLRAHALRRDGDPRARRPALGRDRAGHRGHRRRPAAPRIGGLTKDEAKKEDGQR